MLFKSSKDKNSVFKWGIKVYKKAKDSNRSYYRSFTHGKLNISIGDYALTIVSVKDGEAPGSNKRKCQVTKIIELFEIEINNRRSRHAVVQWFSRVHDLPSHLQDKIPNLNRAFEIVQDNRPELAIEIPLQKLHASCAVLFLDNVIPGEAVMERELYGKPLFYCSWRFDGQQIESVFKPESLKKKVTFSDIGIKPKPLFEPEKETTIKPFCRECNTSFSSFNILADHISIEHFPENSSLPCFFCDSEHPSVSKLKIHYRTHSRPSALTYTCQTCKKQFKLLSQLKAHSVAHTAPYVKGKVFECTECDFTGLFKSMKDHIIKNHKGQYPYSCTFCGKGFLNPSMFLHHKELCKLRGNGDDGEIAETSILPDDEVEPPIILDNDEDSNESLEYEGSTDEEDEGEPEKSTEAVPETPIPEPEKISQATEIPIENLPPVELTMEETFDKLLGETQLGEITTNKLDDEAELKETIPEKVSEDEAAAEKLPEIVTENLPLPEETSVSEEIPEKEPEEILEERITDESDLILKDYAPEVLTETAEEEEEPMDTSEPPPTELHLSEDTNSAIQEEEETLQQQEPQEITFTLDQSSVALTQALGLTTSSESQVHALMEDGTQVVHIINQDQISDEDIGLNPVPGQQQVIVLDPDSAAVLLGQAGKEGNGQTNMVISVEGLYGQQLIAIPQPEGGQQIIQMTEETHELLGKVLENHPQSESQNPEGQIDMLPPIDFPNLSSAVEDMEVEPCLFQQVEASSHTLLATPQFPPSTTTEIINENEFINKDF